MVVTEGRLGEARVGVGRAGPHEECRCLTHDALLEVGTGLGRGKWLPIHCCQLFLLPGFHSQA